MNSKPLLVFRAIIQIIYGWIIKFSISECGHNFLPGIPLKIIDGNNIKIGNNFRSMGYDFMYANNGEIIIGDNISINNNVQIGASGGKIHIGNNVLIGPNVVIRAADHGLSRESLIREQPHQPGEIVIEDDVWIGANAVILKNVKLGKGCVIAAGAVVDQDIEPYKIAGGVPAKIISERV